MTEWQPIETAPLDQWVLVTGEPWERGAPAFAVMIQRERKEVWWEQVSDSRTERRSRTVLEWDGPLAFGPTHWMPLCAPGERKELVNG